MKTKQIYLWHAPPVTTNKQVKDVYTLWYKIFGGNGHADNNQIEINYNIRNFVYCSLLEDNSK